MKRILTSCLVVLICVTAFITGYSKGCYSYAEDIHYMSDAELETAYQAYLQSKGGGLIGNAGARYTYSMGKMLNFLSSESNTTPFKNLNEVKGLMSWQKSELENGTSVLQLAMSEGGASVFSLYTQWLLQNHYFGNGVNQTDGMFDNGIDNELYDGKLYGDSLVYILNKSRPTIINRKYENNDYSSMISKGTYYQYDYKYLWNLALSNYYNSNNGSISGMDINFSMPDGTTKTVNFSGGAKYTNHMNYNDHLEFTTNGQYLYYYNNYAQLGLCAIGVPAIIYFTQSQNYCFGLITYDYQDDKYDYTSFYNIDTFDETPENVDINFYTNINNNISVYPTINQGDTLYITPKVNVGVDGTINYQPITINEGDTISNVVNNYYIDSGTPDKTIAVPSDEPYNDNPSGGGGNNDNPSGPSGGTPPNWNNPIGNLTPNGSDGFDVNFNMPNLNIDWNISGLQEKFPFSIPFDLIRFINVLNAEPETPEFDFTVDLRIYQWHIDADLHQFDNLASIVRNVEFIGFCITLIMITRRMIKG